MWQVSHYYDGRVLVEADYEILTVDEAHALAAALRDVAEGRAHLIAEGGTRYATKAEYDAED